MGQREDNLNVQLFSWERKLLPKEHEELMEICRDFWVSPWGKAAIKKSREVPILKQNDKLNN